MDIEYDRFHAGTLNYTVAQSLKSNQVYNWNTVTGDVRIKAELLMAVSIPIIFTVSVVAFYNFLPPESMTLGNLISYLSSLSTILMVLVVIFTTSMQLKAMKSATTLQNQPLPFIEPMDKSYLEAIAVFHDVPASETYPACRLFFHFNVENVGNGTAVAIDIVPRLIYTNASGKVTTEEAVCTRIDSLKQKEKIEEDIMFTQDRECAHARNFLSPDRPLSLIELTVYYKNILGACFKEKISFEVWFYEEDEDKLKSCIKLLDGAKIDYAREMQEINVLAERDEKRAIVLIAKLNKEVSKKEGCEDIQVVAHSVTGSFSVTSISEGKYRKELKGKGYGRLLGIEKSKEKVPFSLAKN